MSYLSWLEALNSLGAVTRHMAPYRHAELQGRVRNREDEQLTTQTANWSLPLAATLYYNLGQRQHAHNQLPRALLNRLDAELHNREANMCATQGRSRWVSAPAPPTSSHPSPELHAHTHAPLHTTLRRQ